MHSFSEYLYNSSPESQLSRFFESAGPALSARLTLDNFDFELNAISEFESYLPDSFATHLDMILAGGANAASQYYQDLSRGKEMMFEKIKGSIEASDFQKIDESLKELRKLLKEKYAHITEQVAIDFNSKFGDITNSDTVDTAIAGSPKSTASKSQLISLLKALWDGLTDNSDPLSIFQLVLDIVGIFDPFGVADAINMIIYFGRGRVLLGLISLVAFALPYAGDTFKLLKLGKTGKYAEKFVAYTIKDGANGAKTYLELIPKANRGPVMKVISMITENISGIMAKLGGALSSFFGKYLAKYTKWIPGAEQFFINLSKRFEKYTATINQFVKDVKYVEGTAPIAAMADLSTAVKAGSKLEKDAASGLIRLYNADGKIIREFSEEFLKKQKFWKNLPSNPLVKGISETSDLIKYYNAIAKVSPSLLGSVSKMLSVIHKGITKKTAFLLFVGKQIIKMATGKTPDELGMSEDQTKLTAAEFLNNAVQKKIDEEKAKGAKYVPFVTFDGSNNEDYKTVTKYQNDWSKLIGGPEVIPVLYDKFGDPELTKEYNDFWKKEEGGSTKTSPESDEVVWKKVGSGDSATWKKVEKGSTTPVSNIIKDVPNLKTTDWYKEAFPQVSHESLDLLSFDKFINS